MSQYPPKMSKMSNIPPKWAKMKGIRIFYYIFIYTFMEKNCQLLIPPKWGDSLQRVCRQTILDIPSTFRRPCIRTVVQQIVDLWQYVTSGLCNHSLISHLGFPTTKIGPRYQWYCSLIGHHYADFSTWCNTLIRHGKTKKTGGNRQCADREGTFSSKQLSIVAALCGL